MKSIIILLIILLGTLLFYNFVNIIEPLSSKSSSCVEASKVSSKLSSIDKSIDNFKKKN
jgi:hypothetical protein